MKTYKCAVCGTEGVWTREWARYGSTAIDEDCGHFFAICSDACMLSDRASTLIIGFELAHSGKCKGWAS